MTVATTGRAADLSLWVDESEKGWALAVGGVLVNWSEVPTIVDKWRKMKEGLGLQPDHEVKWSIGREHPARKALEASGYKTHKLCEEAVRLICSLNLCCIVAIMVEQRNMNWWKRVFGKASVRDFYCEGLKYVVQRAADEVAGAGAGGCAVICDTPGLGKKEFKFGSIRRASRAVELSYQEWHRTGVGSGPSRCSRGPLQGLGFHPSVLISDATYHDMLQLADVVVGLIAAWVDAVRKGEQKPLLIGLMKMLRGKLRAKDGLPEFWGDGFVVWPRDEELWNKLKNSLE